MKKFGLLGEKLSHSWSPIIHKYIYNEYNIDASYELLECNEAELIKYIDLLKEGKYSGFNVTIPYKKTIMKYLDEIDSVASSIGSVNTIYLKDGKVIGTNTDYDGFKLQLDYYNIDCLNKNAYVLGTGGASLAIKKVLLDLGANVNSVSRNPKNDMLSYEDLDNINNIDILVNTTPVGMYPNVSLSPVKCDIARKAKVVIDIIFNPLKTQLLEDSNSSYHGLFMLVGQALKSECIWLNEKIDIDLINIVKYVEDLKCKN